MSGTIILLNGPSASGKSSIQKKVQEYFNEPYLSLGIDTLFDQLLPDYYGLGEVEPKGHFKTQDIRWVETVDVEGQPAVKLHVGPIGRRVIQGMHQAIAAYAKAGNPLVIDYILYDSDWFSELVEALAPFKVYYIGIDYPLSVLEERESKRATSPVGHARSHFQTVHHYSQYDLTISDPTLSPTDIALNIQAFIEQTPEPTAFNEYQKLFRS